MTQFAKNANYEKLIPELQNDPLGRGYEAMLAAKDYSGLLADFQNPVHEVRTPVYLSYRSILSVIEDPGRLDLIRTFFETNLPTIHDMLSHVGETDGSDGGLDLSKQNTRNFIQSLVGTANYQFTQEEADTICGLGLKMVGRDEVIGLPAGWLTVGRLESAHVQMGG